MMHLAWLSSDARVRNVALRWRARTADDDCLLVESSCIACGIQPGDFVGGVAVTAWELDSGLVDALLGGIEGAYWRFEDSLNRLLDRAPTDQSPKEMPSCQEPWLSVRRRDDPCDQVVELRRRWRLSQTQLAFLLMVSGRTVELWESRRVKPGRRNRWFLALLERYAATHGISALHRRFLGQLPRYGKRGRPAANAISPPG